MTTGALNVKYIVGSPPTTNKMRITRISKKFILFHLDYNRTNLVLMYHITTNRESDQME